jgi:hypothetical protein
MHVGIAYPKYFGHNTHGAKCVSQLVEIFV